MQRQPKKLRLSHETIRALTPSELKQAAGGSDRQKTEGGCTNKNSYCNKCGITTVM
jgi:hypothetical protein